MNNKVHGRGLWLASVAVILSVPAAAAEAPSAPPAAAPPGTGVDDPSTVIVTARRRAEDAQAIPVSLSVVGGRLLDTTYTVNTNELSQLVASVNYSSPNPRNTAFTIRGLGSSVVAVAQANDGLEPGVGFYVDQVYHARPATAAFDFTDIERIEVLRGPQGTLFGKNSTAGAISITTRLPTFNFTTQDEVSFGNEGFVQAKAAVSGPLIDDRLALRLSGSLTRRDGVLRNVNTGSYDNNLHNDAVRAELLFKATDRLQLRLIGDYSDFVSTCCTQVYVTVGTTLKPAARQYPALAAGLGYAPPSLNPYDRLTDIDAGLGVNTNEGGVSLIGDWDIGGATITSVSAWRFWNWDAANDRDYTGLSIQTLQHIPSRQDQYSQELRIASDGARKLSYVAGLYYFNQKITGEPISKYGPVATYWLLGPAPAIPTNLLDGYATDGRTDFLTNSYAAFGEATWKPVQRLSLTGGLRYTYETKYGSYFSTVSGGLATTNPALIKNKFSILQPQAYTASVNEGSLTGRANTAYQIVDDTLLYASYARGNKSGGINESGLPLNAAGQPALNTAVIRPEQNTTFEVGVKSKLFGRRLNVALDLFHTTVRDFQANVVDSGPGALRGYLANIPRVTVQGVEFDANATVNRHLSLRTSLAYSDGKYASYPAAPCPLELIGSTTSVCDLSGRPLSGLPKFVASYGGEYVEPVGGGNDAFLHVEANSRTSAYGDPSDSRYTLIKGYTTVNASIGLRARQGWEVAAFARNLTNANYLQNVTIQAGNSGLVVGTPSDPRTFGLTLRVRR